MIQIKMALKRVIPTAMVGVALFLFSCKPAVQLKRPVAKKAPAAEQIYANAEALFSQGKIDEALSLYLEYVKLMPGGKRAADCLRRVGDIYLERDKLDEALEAYGRIRKDFPGYEHLAEVGYGIISVLYKTGALDDAIAEGEQWIAMYPDSGLKPDVALMLGRCYYSKLEEDKALHWLIMAEGGFETVDRERASAVSSEITRYINEADKTALEKMIVISKGTNCYPQVAYRLASIYYQMDELEKAEETVTELLQAPVEEKWLAQARGLYAKIFLALNVEPNKVGCLLPLSGPFGIYGQEVLNGVETAMDIFGDTHSHMEVVIKDTAGNPIKAAEGIEALVRQQHVVAAMGPLLSRCAEQASERAEAMGLPLITLCRKEDIVGKGHMIFRNFMLPKREVEQLVHVAMDRLDIRRFAIMYPANAYGRYFMQLFWDEVEKWGGEIRAAESYDPSITDFGAQIKRMVGVDIPRPAEVLEKIRDARSAIEEESELDPGKKDPIVDFGAVFIPDSAERVAMIAPQLVYHDVVDIWLLGTSLWDSPKLLELAGDYLQGAIFTSGFFASSADDQVRQFVESYRSNYEKDPELLAATGYDTIQLLKLIVEQNAPRTRKQMREAIVQCPGFKGLTGNISFDTTGEVKKKPFVVSVLGNKEVLFP